VVGEKVLGSNIVNVKYSIIKAVYGKGSQWYKTRNRFILSGRASQQNRFLFMVNE